jgi:phage shock protein C
MEKRAYRNTQDKVIAGVCTGLGEYFGIDPLFIRIVFLLFLFEPPIAVVAYIALWIALPKKPIQMPMIGNVDTGEDSKSFEQKVDDFGKEAEEIGKTLGKEAEVFGEKIQKKVEAFAEQLEGTMSDVKNKQNIHFSIDIESKPKKGKAMGIILISLGIVFLANNFLPDFDIERFWPMILIGIGFSILFSGKKEGQS